jgi:hypothetical protein
MHVEKGFICSLFEDSKKQKPGDSELEPVRQSGSGPAGPDKTGQDRTKSSSGRTKPDFCQFIRLDEIGFLPVFPRSLPVFAEFLPDFCQFDVKN